MPSFPSFGFGTGTCRVPVWLHSSSTYAGRKGGKRVDVLLTRVGLVFLCAFVASCIGVFCANSTVVVGFVPGRDKIAATPPRRCSFVEEVLGVAAAAAAEAVAAHASGKAVQFLCNRQALFPQN